MLEIIVIILIVLWILGYMPLAGFSVPNVALFTLNGHTITLWNILILLAVGWAISLLPRPLQSIASVLLFLWIVSTLGFISLFAGLPSIIVILIIVLLVISILR